MPQSLLLVLIAQTKKSVCSKKYIYIKKAALWSKYRIITINTEFLDSTLTSSTSSKPLQCQCVERMVRVSLVIEEHSKIRDLNILIYLDVSDNAFPFYSLMYENSWCRHLFSFLVQCFKTLQSYFNVSLFKIISLLRIWGSIFRKPNRSTAP